MIELGAQTAKIEREVSDGKLQSTTKTGTAHTVDLTERATERLRVRLANACQAADTEGQEMDDDALVFATTHGNVLDHANVVRRFRALPKKAGLPTFRLYDLRHSYATHALAAGAPITYVAKQRPSPHAGRTRSIRSYQPHAGPTRRHPPVGPRDADRDLLRKLR